MPTERTGAKTVVDLRKSLLKDVMEEMESLAAEVEATLKGAFPKRTGLARRSFKDGKAKLTKNRITVEIEGIDYSKYVHYKGTDVNALQDIIDQVVRKHDFKLKDIK